MKFHCCDLRRLEVLKRSGHRQRASSSSRCSIISAPPGAPRQRTLFVRLLRPGFDARRPTTCASTAASASAPSASSGCAPADALPPQAEPAWSTGRRPAAHAGGPHRQSRGDFSRYTLSIVANSGSDQPPAGFDPMLSSHRVLVQGRVPVGLRLRAAAALSAARRVRSPDIDYLAKDYTGFRRLMLDRLSLLVPGWTRALGRRSRRGAGRAAGLCRRQPLLPPGRDRQRGLSRHRAPARVGAPPCAAWSTTSCTRAATPAPWCTSTSPGRT